ncbi:DUF2975 domain-containing protein [Anaerosporobacter sp.]|uniref:DUF2975 domain-containing protein n=1 Tax=Anaerosporobacter sp. TaxID=1872529 RepID=UPI00286EB7B9|nr:DUF2975 domain-containing protein [Anaerosporobacter sp.]
MKKIHKLINEPFARSAALFMKCICYLAMLFFVVGLILSFMGRQTFILRTSTGFYENAIYSEEDHNWTSRGPTISMKDEIRVFAYDGEKIDLLTQIGLSTMYAVNMIPLILCFWFLSRVFNNISNGQIFTEQNASYLLYYGLLQMAVAVFVPFIKVFICYLTNQFTNSTISISTGQNLLNDLIPNIVFLVAAYIIHYGVHLQDEVDHTL